MRVFLRNLGNDVVPYDLLEPNDPEFASVTLFDTPSSFIRPNTVQYLKVSLGATRKAPWQLFAVLGPSSCNDPGDPRIRNRNDQDQQHRGRGAPDASSFEGGHDDQPLEGQDQDDEVELQDSAKLIPDYTYRLVEKHWEAFFDKEAVDVYGDRNTQRRYPKANERNRDATLPRHGIEDASSGGSCAVVPPFPVDEDPCRVFVNGFPVCFWRALFHPHVAGNAWHANVFVYFGVWEQMCAQVEQRMAQDNHEGTKSQEEIMQEEEQEAKIRSGAVHHDLVSDAPLNYAGARTPEACYEWRQTSGTPTKIDRTSLLYALANLNRHTEQLPMDLSVPRDDPRSGVELRSKASKECSILMNDLAGGFKNFLSNGNALAVPAGVVLPETREIFETRQRNLIAAFVKWYPLAMHEIADHNFTPGPEEQVGHGPPGGPSSSSSQTREMDTNLSCFNLFSYIPPRSLLSCSYLDMDLTRMALGQKFTERPKTLEVEREASSDETARTTGCSTDRSVFSKQVEDLHLSAQNPYTAGAAEQAASSVVEDNANDPSVTTFLCGQRPALWTLLQGVYSEPTLNLAVVKRLLLAKKPRRRTAAGTTMRTHATSTSKQAQAARNGEQDSLFLIPRLCLNYVQLSDTAAIRRENIKHKDKQCLEPDDGVGPSNSLGKRAAEPDGLLTEDDRLWLGRAQPLDPKRGITVTTPSMAGPGTATHRIEDLTPRSFTHQLPLHTLPSHYTHVLFGILHLYGTGPQEILSCLRLWREKVMGQARLPAPEHEFVATLSLKVDRDHLV